MENNRKSWAELYAQQYQWRRWSEIYPDLGNLSGATLVDLGCGIGDQVRDLTHLGAAVFGIDSNKEAIDYALTRGITGARFVCDKITNLSAHNIFVDGVWAGFTAAYFPNFEVFIRSVRSALKPGGWLAIVELDDIFGHSPLAMKWRRVVDSYYALSLQQGIYRFNSQQQVKSVLTQSGWRIEVDRTVEDDEFCFTGPAPVTVIDAWKTRLGFMMPRFLERFGEDARGFDDAFLECLESPEHRSNARVWFILARSPKVT